MNLLLGIGLYRDEGLSWSSRDDKQLGLQDPAVVVRRGVDRVHGHFSRILGLHSFLLPGGIYGPAIYLELGTRMLGPLPAGEEGRPSAVRLSGSLRRWRLGDGATVAGGCVCLGWAYSVVQPGLEVVQGGRLLEFSVSCLSRLLELVLGLAFLSRHALAPGRRINPS